MQQHMSSPILIIFVLYLHLGICDEFDDVTSKPGSGAEQSGSVVVREIIETFIDILFNTLKSSMNSQSGIINFLKPFMTSAGMYVLSEAINLTKTIINDQSFIDESVFRENKYEAFPMYIPEYGSFMLLSEVGTIERIKNKFDNSVMNRDDLKNITNGKENMFSTDELNQDDLLLGKAFIIPLQKNLMDSESSKDLDDSDGVDEKVVQKYIKEIMKSRTSLKKRFALGVMKQIEKTMFNF